MKSVLIDVREYDEFDAEHIDGAINVPLSGFTSMAPGILNQLKDRQIAFVCRSGARSAQALQIAETMGFNDIHAYTSVDGGLQRWKAEGRPLVSARRASAPMPLMRQVQLLVGVSLVLFTVLSWLLHPAFALGAAAMGAGLLHAGITGNCLMALILKWAPWNRRPHNPGLGQAA